MRLLATVFSLLLFATACQSSGDNELVIMAASSFQVVADELAQAFEADTDQAVAFNLAGSQTLATQIDSGAPADALLSASAVATMQAGGRISLVRPILTNELVVLVPAGNPKQIAGLASLTDPELVVVLADPAVPAGAYTVEALDQAGLTLQPSSLDPSAAKVAARVAEGEADAGIGYLTDAVNPLIHTVALGDGITVNAEYFGAIVDESAGGTQFLDWLRGDSAKAILESAGFTT